ncbi:MAG: carboxypeptidase regulatory-like domain-containing protein [Caldilineaceae bacterium]
MNLPMAANGAAAYTLYHPSFVRNVNGANSTLYLHNESVASVAYQATFIHHATSALVTVNGVVPAVASAALAAQDVAGLPDGPFSVAVSSDAPLSSVVRTHNATSSTLSLYRGQEASPATSTLYFGPFFKTVERSSNVLLMHVGTATATATIQARTPTGSIVYTNTITTQPGTTTMISADSFNLSPFLTGWLQVDADQPMVGLLAPSADPNYVGLYPPMAVQPAANVNAAAVFTNFIPRLYREFSEGGGARSTHLFAGNLEPTQATVNIIGYKTDGAQGGTGTYSVSPSGSLLWTGAEIPSGFSGAAVLASDKTLGVAELPISNGGYPMASYKSGAPQPAVIMPYVGHGSDRYAILTVQNAGSAAATITVNFHALNGASGPSFSATVPAGASATFDTRTMTFGNGYTGFVSITSDQLVVANLDEYVIAQSGGFISCADVTEIPATECNALVDLFNSTNGLGWTNSTGWLKTNTPCNWYGVSCALGHVSELYLLENNLNGTIPSSLDQLSELRVLHFADNVLSSSLPLEIGGLSNLEEIHLGNNQLSGPLPASLGNLSKLRKLWIFNNQIQGAIPAELMDLTGLTQLGLFGNQLVGPLPTGWQNLTQLEYLGLAENPIGGTIPMEIGNLTNLRTIYWANSQLTGVIPASFSNLTNLEELMLNNNQLDGPIPIFLGNLTKLRNLSLHHNLLSGIIPPSLGNLSALEDLALSDNPLAGSIPSGLGNLTNLRTLSLYQAQLTGPIPTTFGQLTNLEVFYGWSNQLTGTLPIELGNLTKLRSLDLPWNQFSGAIPPELGNLTNLEQLILDGSQLTGPIPNSLQSLTKLKELKLSHNELTGPIPTWIAGFSQLEELRLNNNNFNGPLPGGLGDLTRLTLLHAHDNQLTGSIPATFGQLLNLTELDLSNNMLGGSIPSELGNLTALIKFRLWDNQLSGALPTSLANLLLLEDFHVGGNQLTGVFPQYVLNFSNLRRLELWGNQLPGEFPLGLTNLAKLAWLDLGGIGITGSIPTQMSQLKDLEVLVLAWNDLEGSIPTGLGSLTKLYRLDLSNNQLAGPIPTNLSNLPHLRLLLLHSNQLTGGIPAELANSPSLEILATSWNPLGGTIPPQLGNLSTLRELYIWDNDLTGPLPKELSKLTNLRLLSAGENNLTGTIPPELGQLANLEELYLYDNQLEGELPSELGNLAKLWRISLSANRFSGAIPAALGNLTNLDQLYIWDNHLSGPLPAELAALTNLNVFHFHTNQLCEPAAPAMQTWLENILYLESTDILCGAAPAQITGLVTDISGNKLPNIAVTLYRHVQAPDWVLWQQVASTTTDPNGAYRFDNLGATGYSLFFADPTGQYGDEYYDDAGTLAASTTVTPTLGPSTTINVMLDAPTPPAIEVQSDSGRVTTDTKTGEVIIAMPRPNKSNVVIRRTVICPEGGAASNVQLVADWNGAVKSYPMTLTSTANVYRAAIPEGDIVSNATLAVKATCGGAETTTEVGQIQLYDPSGIITDANTGQPIANATVMLYRVPGWLPKLDANDSRVDTCQSNSSKSVGAPWNQPAPTDLGALVNPDEDAISPTVNHMLTDSAGRYGWDVAQGCWYVVVSAAGYVSKTSPLVGVPPAVTDLNLALEPLPVSEVTPTPVTPTPVTPTPVTPTPLPTGTPQPPADNDIYLPTIRR